jgi:hypothetical protein
MALCMPDLRLCAEMEDGVDLIPYERTLEQRDIL